MHDHTRGRLERRFMRRTELLSKYLCWYNDSPQLLQFMGAQKCTQE